MTLTIVILTTGKSTHFKSKTPKVLYPLGGQPLLAYSFAVAAQLTHKKPLLVVEPKTEAAIREWAGDRAHYARQTEALGSVHAVKQTRDLLKAQTASILVLHGDQPLLQAATLQKLIDLKTHAHAAIAMLTRVHSTPAQLASHALNPSSIIFDADFLWAALPRLQKDTYLLADLINLAAEEGLNVINMPFADPDEAITVQTRVDLAAAAAALQHRLQRHWMLQGVTLIDPASTYLSPHVRIGQDTVIHPNTHLRGATTIGADCTLGPNTLIAHSTIGNRCTVLASVLEYATMEDESDIGPFGHLRKGAYLCTGAHMGNFGEIKNSTLGPGAKMGHFSYLGDAEIGANVNIGAGTITCNYDGQHKHRTVLEDNVFIGSNTLLVAPVHIGAGAQTGAGSVVTRDIHAHTLAYGVPAQPHKKLDKS